MNRIEFFDSISGIQYPTMLVDFFDHFLALKEIVENTGRISVHPSSNNNRIIFDIDFSNDKAKETVIGLLRSTTTVMIYNRPIYVNLIGIPVDKKQITIELF